MTDQVRRHYDSPLVRQMFGGGFGADANHIQYLSAGAQCGF